MPAFIETRQTLTRLGHCWGRFPLILVRASVVGLLVPATNNPKMDQEGFLRILTMDDEGAVQRWKRSERFIGSLERLTQLGRTAGMDAWQDDSEAARILAGRSRNDHA